MIKWAGAMYSRTVRDANGRTPYELRCGKRFLRSVPVWGEKVLCMPNSASRKASRMGPESRFVEGIVLGMADRSRQWIVGTSKGLLGATTIKRLEPTERGDAVLLNKVVGTPWQPIPNVPTGDTGKVAMAAKLEPLAPAVFAKQLGTIAKRLYIRRRCELKKYGYSDSCQGCTAAARGAKAKPHSEPCRQRILHRMLADTDPVVRPTASRVAAGRPHRD